MMSRNLSNKMNIALINDKTFMKKDTDGFLRVIDLVHNANQIQNSQKYSQTQFFTEINHLLTQKP